VIEGGRHACKEAGIALAGGHSIDAPEPIFGLAVTGQVENNLIKCNNKATANCDLFLTKPLGIGILTTAEKKKCLKEEHSRVAIDTMLQLNKHGAEFARLPYVTAMTDVTGFGLMGHLTEICLGSDVHAVVNYHDVPKLPELENYIAQDCSPGGAQRNFDSYGHHLADINNGDINEVQKKILCDPQTSGGLLVAVDKNHSKDFIAFAQSLALNLQPLGELVEKNTASPLITIS
jgi:selenide,water dikinase